MFLYFLSNKIFYINYSFRIQMMLQVFIFMLLIIFLLASNNRHCMIKVKVITRGLKTFLHELCKPSGVSLSVYKEVVIK